MHEMAMAQGVMEIVEDYAQKSKAKKVCTVALLIGEMTGVVPESLEFCFKAVAKGTVAEDAKIKLTNVPLMGHCNNCGNEWHIENYNFFCPQCSSAKVDIISGRELRVEYLEVD
ncbi:hydrogenase maturation nickel metallochaperone HypA [Pectinatus cerevisiiphilus]|uniref:Hydrogenase maturation factor HypA n=1 Tax=Pectinatus cerevisiiphilus TaxID=86956 RepID=A0A4R3K7Y6_9FIRM|nr:hydrogenase maturation nickel metallochaperone HypA [Pectinatus cerevisiiphilus]TCS78965.1 hydrogenase-3 nickel incorporation protein HypA [Pectinatus cerevisiiphilus]